MKKKIPIIQFIKGKEVKIGSINIDPEDLKQGGGFVQMYKTPQDEYSILYRSHNQTQDELIQCNQFLTNNHA